MRNLRRAFTVAALSGLLATAAGTGYAQEMQFFRIGSRMGGSYMEYPEHPCLKGLANLRFTWLTS